MTGREPFEVEVCGTLMLGSGTDSYDPLCELPLHHGGSCRSTAAVDQHRIKRGHAHRRPRDAEDSITDV